MREHYELINAILLRELPENPVEREAELLENYSTDELREMIGEDHE